MAVLRNLKADEAEELRRLRAENEALKAKRSERSFTMKIGDKGGMSVYMGSRFPTTLYYEQWLHLLSHKEEILEWLEANHSRLKIRD